MIRCLRKRNFSEACSPRLRLGVARRTTTTAGMATDPLPKMLIQQLSFLKCFAENDLTTEHAESTEEELRRLLFLVFSVASVFSVVNAIDDGC